MAGFQQDVFLGSTPTSNLATVVAELDAKSLFIDGTKAMTANLGLGGNEMVGTKGIQLNEQVIGDIPTPAQGVTIYSKNDGNVYKKNDSGTEAPIGGGVSTPGTTAIGNVVGWGDTIGGSVTDTLVVAADVVQASAALTGDKLVVGDGGTDVKTSTLVVADVVQNTVGVGASTNLVKFGASPEQIADSALVVADVVQASVALTSTNLVRGDGGGKDVQTSGITLAGGSATELSGLTKLTSSVGIQIDTTSGVDIASGGLDVDNIHIEDNTISNSNVFEDLNLTTLNNHDIVLDPHGTGLVVLERPIKIPVGGPLTGKVLTCLNDVGTGVWTTNFTGTVRGDPTFPSATVVGNLVEWRDTTATLVGDSKNQLDYLRVNDLETGTDANTISNDDGTPWLACRNNGFVNRSTLCFGVGAGASYTVTAPADGSNIAIGFNSLNVMNGSSAENNIAIGARALENLSSLNCSSNIAIGRDTLNSCEGVVAGSTSGQIAIGDNSQFYHNPTSYLNTNVSLGAFTLYSGTDLKQNTAIGDNALRTLATTGTGNVGLGYHAGYNTQGDYNILIGHDVEGTTEDQTIRIGNEQTTCYIKGIDGVYISHVHGIPEPVIVSGVDQIGALTGFSCIGGKYSQMTDVTITNTTAITTMLDDTGAVGSVTFPANTIKKGDCYTIRIAGLMECESKDERLDINMYLDGDNIYKTNPTMYIAEVKSGEPEPFELVVNLSVREIGNPSATEASGRFSYMKDDEKEGAGKEWLSNTSATVLSTFATNEFTATAEWDVASTDNTLIIKQFTITKTF